MVTEGGRNRIRILALSDVAVGYGSPQVQYLLDSLRRHYRNASVTMVEPDQKRRARRDPLFPEIEVIRVVTTMPPYDGAFHVEYNLELRKIIEERKPHILIATHGWVLPSILTANWKPDCFIYYMLESLTHQRQGMGELAIEINRQALGVADIVLTPEIHRSEADLRAVGWTADGFIEIFNSSHGIPEKDLVPADERRERILYSGSIGPATLTSHLAQESLSSVKFDIAGPAETEEARQMLAELQRRPNVNYLGVLPASELAKTRGQYAYSLVMWNPTDINQLYASPNKFFETIQAGVPPIAAPHPQCTEIIDRYKCGQVMADWEADSFSKAVTKAMRLFRTDRRGYSDMVAGCLKASKTELKWDIQFRKVVSRLPGARALTGQPAPAGVADGEADTAAPATARTGSTRSKTGTKVSASAKKATVSKGSKSRSAKPKRGPSRNKTPDTSSRS
ncbi:MAG: hypothetical protein CMF74_05800 [Maricaulis sp.]|jgi:glycosyltransferase involved in cell wall biosynthesis|nr:hypothetical protein [Maricaulis sp.]